MLWGFAVVGGMTAVYYLAAKLALLLAIPPGYASGVWPAAGLALGGALLFGKRVAWGVLLGSFLANLSTSLDTTSNDVLLPSLALPALLGLGAAAQTLVARHLVRRFVGFPTDLVKQRDVLKFLALGGPVACIVAATWGVVVLGASGTVSQEYLAFNWWTWWVGDTIGTLIFAPMCVIFRGVRNTEGRKRFVRVALPMGFTFVLAVLLFVFAMRSAEAELNRQFEDKTTRMSQAVVRDLDAYLEVLGAVGAFFDSTEDVDRDRFTRFVTGFLERHKAMRAFSWNTLVKGDERDTYEERVRRQNPGFEIKEINALHEFVRAPDRPVYSVIEYSVPENGNSIARGYNTYSEPNRIRALDLARDTGEPIGTGRVILVQDEERQAGFVIYLPIYRPRAERSTVEDRRENLMGYVGNIYRMNELVAAALVGTDRSGIEMVITDLTSQPGDGELYNDRAPDAESPQVNTHILAREVTYQIAGRTWVLHYYSKPDAWLAQRSWQGWTVLAVGFLFSGLLGAFMLVVTGHSQDVERQVVLRTSALRASEERFRSVTEAANDAVIVADASGKIFSWNHGAELLFGYATAEVVGQPLTLLLPERNRGRLDNPLANFLRADADLGRNEPIEISGRRKDGYEVPIELSFTRWQAGDQRFVGGIIRDVSHRKQVERELRESAEQLRMLVESTRDYAIYMLDADGHVATWNKGAALVKGFDSDEIIGEYFGRFFPESARKAGVPERILELAREHGWYEDESWRVRKDGSVFWANAVISAVRSADGRLLGYAKVTRDLSERKKSEQLVRESRERLDLAIESARMGIWDLNVRTNRVIRSPRHEQIYGHEGRVEEWTLDGIWSAVHPDDLPSVRAAYRSAFDTNVLTTEHRVKWHDGSVHWVRSEGRVFRSEEGVPLRVVGVTWETTELRQLQEQLEERNAALQVESERAQEASRLKSEFLANMSHELRTPLNGVIGFTEFLVDEKAGPVTTTQREFLNDVLSSARHLLNLINDLLDLAKIEAGKMELFSEEMSVHETVDEVAHVFEVTAMNKGLRFEREVRVVEDPRRMDKQRFRQILYNLVSNAVKFTPAGGHVHLLVSDLQDNGILIRVRDTGIGIAQMDLQRLFVEFQQLDTGATRRYQGTGLGLALTRKLVALHDGTIRVKSELGKGSTFTVTLPGIPLA